MYTYITNGHENYSSSGSGLTPFHLSCFRWTFYPQFPPRGAWVFRWKVSPSPPSPSPPHHQLWGWGGVGWG